MLGVVWGWGCTHCRFWRVLKTVHLLSGPASCSSCGTCSFHCCCWLGLNSVPAEAVAVAVASAGPGQWLGVLWRWRRWRAPVAVSSIVVASWDAELETETVLTRSSCWRRQKFTKKKKLIIYLIRGKRKTATFQWILIYRRSRQFYWLTVTLWIPVSPAQKPRKSRNWLYAANIILCISISSNVIKLYKNQLQLELSWENDSLPLALH